MRERVLVVEDHPDLRALCVGALRRAGYEVAEADSGVTAQRILLTDRVDLLITDLKQPGLGGLELLKIAKEADSEIVVILVTGFPTVETAVSAMKSGASDYLVKPFSEEQLLSGVAAALKER
jgi:DNA-binding NtrC family response regulator